MKAAIYHRVSTLDQNPDAARDELRAHAVRIGATVELLVEETMSTRKERSGLQTVLAAAEKGKVDVVLVWKLDRFGRSVLDVLANVRRLETAGVRFIVTTQGLDVRPQGDAVSRLTLTILGAVAEFERDLIRERTLLGLARARKKGRVGGRRVVNNIDRERVTELRTAGRSWSQVAAELGCSTSAARRAVGELGR